MKSQDQTLKKKIQKDVLEEWQRDEKKKKIEENREETVPAPLLQ